MKTILLTLIMSLYLSAGAQVYNVKALATFNPETGNSNYVEVENVKVIIYNGMFMCANQEDDCTYFFTNSKIELPEEGTNKYEGKSYLHTDATLEIWQEKDLYKCKIKTKKGCAYFFLSGKDSELSSGLCLQ